MILLLPYFVVKRRHIWIYHIMLKGYSGYNGQNNVEAPHCAIQGRMKIKREALACSRCRGGQTVAPLLGLPTDPNSCDPFLVGNMGNAQQKLGPDEVATMEGMEEVCGLDRKEILREYRKFKKTFPSGGIDKPNFQRVR